ncbi:MAG: PqqD family protein [Pyrinomonadaceae bacterium]|nr:PqqD family protein [Pyrinomonadaceae bacterium]
MGNSTPYTPEERVFPKARTDQIVQQPAGDELLIYDLRKNVAHNLDASAAEIWKLCDGNRSVSAIAAGLGSDQGAEVSKEFVIRGLEQLQNVELLEDSSLRIGRRTVIAGALPMLAAVPVVLTLKAPLAAQQQSCVPNGGNCDVDANCCEFFCADGVCIGKAKIKVEETGTAEDRKAGKKKTKIYIER